MISYTVLQYGIAVAIFRFGFPTVFAEEVKHPLGILLWTFLFGLPLSLFEYLYHRYLLHSAVLPFLGEMHRAHSHHHGLTAVKAPVLKKEPEKLVPVFNEYPVVHEYQEEDMMFPYFAVSVFFLLFSAAYALPVKLIASSQPVFFGIINAVVLYYSAYELWHAVLHFPFNRFWKPRMDSPKIGPTVRYIYGFHLMHHWRPTSNLAVVGFWGVALWDHVFRTHHRPKHIPIGGAQVNFYDADMAKPRLPIAILDKWQAGMFRWSRKVENWGARVFLGRKSTDS
jgi:hypothetical protein